MSDCPMLISNKLHSFRNFMKQILGIENQVYRVEALKLPIDKEKKFYVFIIDKDLSIEKFFLPHYEQKGLMIYYLDLLKKTL